MSTSYRPELDVLEQPDDEKSSWYMSAVGIFCWAVELGRINICMETSLLGAQMAMPTLGHLYAVIQVFGYLQRKMNAQIVMDPSMPRIHYDVLKDNDWTGFYGNTK